MRNRADPFRSDGLKELVKELVGIGISLTSETDLDTLLNRILAEARKFTSADAGTLYIREGDTLRFAATQNDTLKRNIGPKELKKLFSTIPISTRSIVGWVVMSGASLNIEDVYTMDTEAPYTFNREFDQKDNYRTRSMLTVPMKDPKGSVIGVLQLINSTEADGDIVSFPRDVEPLVQSLASQAAVAIRNAQLTETLKNAHYDTIHRLSNAAEYRDEMTFLHIKRISRYSLMLAETLALPKEERELIYYASPMHDVGKIGIPDSILLKPGPLTPEERKIMETHTAIGARIFENPGNDMMEASRIVAISHHEKWDGTGYPNRLKGTDIPLFGRVVALADVFDALSSKRPYKDPFPIEKCVGIVKSERGKHFDPDILDAFFKDFDEVLAIRKELMDQ